MTFRYWTFDVMLLAEGVLSELNVQKLLDNPPVLVILDEESLNREIALLDRLVERAMKKKPQSVPIFNEPSAVLCGSEPLPQL